MVKQMSMVWSGGGGALKFVSEHIRVKERIFTTKTEPMGPILMSGQPDHNVGFNKKYNLNVKCKTVFSTEKPKQRFGLVYWSLSSRTEEGNCKQLRSYCPVHL